MRLSHIAALGLSQVAVAQNSSFAFSPLAASSPTPSSSPSSLPDDAFPAEVGDYEFYGCVASSAGFPGFKLDPSSGESNSINTCAESCDSELIGLFDTDCYCGEELAEVESMRVTNDRCNNPCPGDEDQYCGGVTGTRRLTRRQSVPRSVLLTVYSRKGATPSDDDVIGAQPKVAGETPSPGTGGADGSVTQPPNGAWPTLTATVTLTDVQTITTCPPEVPNCPIGHPTRHVKTITSTWCPEPTVEPCHGDCPLPCEGPECVCNEECCFPVPPPCHGETCPHPCDSGECFCENDHCFPVPTPPCHGDHCIPIPSPCYGEHCPPPCEGPECPYPPPCYGENCPPPCYGENCPPACEGPECPYPPPCYGDNCPPECEGESCPPPCYGDNCPPECEGDYCPPACEGPECPYPPTCEGEYCPPECEGENCPPACEGPECPPCEGENCPPPACEGENCPPECEGDVCPPPCEGEYCPPECDGEVCPPPPQCEGENCPPPPCEGELCPPECEGPDCEVTPPPVMAGSAKNLPALIIGAVAGLAFFL